MQQKNASLGEAIRRLRLAKRLTQSELAGDAFSKSYISQLERGNVTPSLRALDLIAAKLGVTASWLIERGEAQHVTLLRAASVAYHLGELDHAAQLLSKAQSQPGTDLPPLLWELLVLRIRLAASRKAWPEVLQACRELQRAASHGVAPPGRIAVPHCYWWGHAWLALGNRRQAIRRWEQGLASLRSWNLEAEALYLLARLAELYESLGDKASARPVRTRLRAMVTHLQTPFDLSRWVMARFSEACRFPSPCDLGEALLEAEAWARAGRALIAAAELRPWLEQDGGPGGASPRQGRPDVDRSAGT